MEKILVFCTQKEYKVFTKLRCKSKLALHFCSPPFTLSKSSRNVSEQASGHNKSLVVFRLVEIYQLHCFSHRLAFIFQESKFPGCPRRLKKPNWPTERPRNSLNDVVFFLLLYLRVLLLKITGLPCECVNYQFAALQIQQLCLDGFLWSFDLCES